jgi:hypothetical protein
MLTIGTLSVSGLVERKEARTGGCICFVTSASRLVIRVVQFGRLGYCTLGRSDNNELEKFVSPTLCHINFIY